MCLHGGQNARVCRGGGGYQRGYSGGMGYYRSPFSMWFSPFDLFYYWSPGYPARQRARLDSGEGLNFLEGIFSFGAPARRLSRLRPPACAFLIAPRHEVV